MNKIKTVFLDRDGVINRDSPDYIKNRDEFVFLPNSTDAVKMLTEHGMDSIVISNQSVINRKMTPPDELDAIFEKMTSGVAEAGGCVKDIFFCPHIPEDNCSCRKPLPGLIQAAREKYGIDLSAACMVGDSAKDIECARNAGCAFSVLVKTGNGLKAERVLAEKNIFPDYVAEDLLDAARWIVKQKIA